MSFEGLPPSFEECFKSLRMCPSEHSRIEFSLQFLQTLPSLFWLSIDRVSAIVIMEENEPSFGGYTTIKVVGKGTFGSVYLVKNKQGKMFAVKHVLQDKRYKNRELEITCKLNHPNIVRLEDQFYEIAGGKQYLNLVLEYLPENLAQRLRLCKIEGKFLPNELVKAYTKQLLKSLQYLEQVNVCHRDIKPSNILINNKELKLCDFGSAKCLVEGEKSISYICSRYYRAPELIFGATLYTNQIDVWSAACVIGEMITNKPLFEGQNSTDQLIRIMKLLGTPSAKDLKGMKAKDIDIQLPILQPLSFKKYFTKINPNVEPELLELLGKLLVFDPNKRLTAKQALNELYFLEALQ